MEWVHLSLDDYTKNKSRSFFAIFVDDDLSFDFLNQILVERQGFACMVDIEYEKIVFVLFKL